MDKVFDAVIHPVLQRVVIGAILVDICGLWEQRHDFSAMHPSALQNLSTALSMMVLAFIVQENWAITSLDIQFLVAM